MSQKLDSFSKILMATGAINYMASSIEGVNQQIKMMKSVPVNLPDYDFEGIHGEGIKQRDEILEETVKDLSVVMEKLGNLINNQDALCAVDIFATKAAFEVVVHGNDDTEGDFDNL